MKTAPTVVLHPKLSQLHKATSVSQNEQKPAIASGSTDFLVVKEAAKFLHCSKSFLDKLRVTGGGPEFVRLGARKVLYRRVDLENWARSRRFENTSQYPGAK